MDEVGGAGGTWGCKQWCIYRPEDTVGRWPAPLTL